MQWLVYWTSSIARAILTKDTMRLSPELYNPVAKSKCWAGKGNWMRVFFPGLKTLDRLTSIDKKKEYNFPFYKQASRQSFLANGLPAETKPTSMVVAHKSSTFATGSFLRCFMCWKFYRRRNISEHVGSHCWSDSLEKRGKRDTRIVAWCWSVHNSIL